MRVKPGPGAHSYEANEELFYVIEGTMTFLVGDQQVDAAAGTFLRIPAGVVHDFENRTPHRAGAFNVFIPGGFESNMPAIVEWIGSRRRDEVERTGIEPATPCLQSRTRRYPDSTSC